MDSTKNFKNSLIKPKTREKKEVIKNKDVFNYKNQKVSSKEKNKVVAVIKHSKNMKKCDCGCGHSKNIIKQMRKKY
jgi:hypothetical protein